jgi:serine/threonine protein kinase
MNSGRSVCPRCGSPEASRALSAGLCPACLIAAALEPDDEPCPYRVLAPISEDEVGVTYLAQALSGEHGYVALKVHDRTDPHAVLSRYERWKPRLNALRHPALARFLDAGITADGLVYVATEYIAGWPLSSCAAHASIDTAAKQTLVRQLAEGIEAAHRAGLAHLRLDASKIKISIANGPRATILGLGTALVVDGLEPQTGTDLASLARISSELERPPSS